MVQKVVLSVFILMVFVFTSCNKNETFTINSTTVNNMQEATGVDLDSFFFSWKMQSSERNVKQTAYQIMVSTKNDFPTEDLVWDSGIIQNEKSILVNYRGNKLDAGQTYFWKVRAWDNCGNESDWSDVNSFISGLFDTVDWSNAKWIGFEELPSSKRLVEGVSGYGDVSLDKVEKRSMVPLFRKEFAVNNKVKKATLFISGIGQYEASLNGVKVGDDFLTPGWTHYDKTILYNTYDITDRLLSGDNAIGVIVGNGFLYNNRERYRKLIIAYGFPQLICKLFIQYDNGKTTTIVSGDDWHTKSSPITYSGIYGGEDYDARLFEEGWNKAGFEMKNWEAAKLITQLDGQLKPDKNNAVKVMQTFEPVEVTQLNDSVYMYDFGQNASGIVSLKVKGASGSSVQIRPGEVLKDDGFVSQRGSGSPYLFNYILNGAVEESWQPRFSYYGFRYAQVTLKSSDYKTDLPEIVEIKALHTRSSAAQTGTFECSNALFNKTFDLINWGIKSNIQSVMTDCPTREKLGWLEQTHLVGASVHYNFNMYNLYSKLIGDMHDAQTEEGLVPNIVPEYINFEYYDAAFRDSPEWGSAAIMQPWLIYKWYGDNTKMHEAWPFMQQYFSYLEKKAAGNILSHGLGDWYDVGPETPGYTQLTPVSLVATAMYYYDAVLMTEIAKTLQKSDEAVRYKKLAEQIKKAFNTKFYNAKTKMYATGSQTSMVMPLSMGMVPESDINVVVQNLVKVVEKDGKQITAGDVGFHYLIDALTKYGQSELLYSMNNRNDVPGYGYQLNKGATSLTESWQALETKSMNHLMLGHLMEWFYKGLAGIGQTKKSVAYKELKIEPQLVNEITSAKASFETPFGTVESDWQDSKERFVLNVSVPVNSTANVILPATTIENVTENNKSIYASDFELEQLNGKVKINVGSGIYKFMVTKKE